MKNAIELPRSISEHELRRPLTLVLEVDAPEQVAGRVFPRTPHTTVRVLDDHHLELVISPALSLSIETAPAPLSDSDRHRLLASESHIRAHAAEVRSIVERIISPRASLARIARAVVDWVHERMSYELTPEQLVTLEVLERSRGDCTEYSVLTVALLRAAGIPSDVRQGFIVSGREVVMHAWVAFHDGTSWREIDPTDGRAWVGSGHVEASVMDFVSLVSLGRLEIVRVGVAPHRSPSLCVSVPRHVTRTFSR